MTSQDLAQEGSALVLTAQELTVVDDAGFTRAGETLKTVKLYLKAAEQVLKNLKTVTLYLKEAEQVLKNRMATYEQEQARLRHEAEEWARREQERLEAEEQIRVAAENARLVREDEDRRLAEAAEAEKNGDSLRAAEILNAPAEIPAVVPRSVFIPPPPMAKPAVAGVSFRDDFDVEVVNSALVPKEYTTPDLVKIRRVVKAMQGKVTIPGVRIITKRVVAARAQ